ncbi:transglutaminase family protein [Marinobacter sp. C2H3]|uniref:transglutaminase family protein n=1 Tax=Marinobacter sp. C2H3 TaxID=3119003 RepID=UPI00300F04DD
MSIHVALNHTTRYRYDRPVNLGPQVVRLRPCPHSRTRILSYSLKVTPAGHFINWQQDPQANYLARLVFPEKTRELCITVDLVAEMAVINPFDFFLEPHAETCPFEYEDWQLVELAPYLHRLPETPVFRAWLATLDCSERPSVDYLVALNQQVCERVDYLIRMEPGVQTPEETLENGSGSCRDSAWLLVQTLRHLGLAARFVSGYLIQLTADQKALDGPSGPEQDFTDLHAWCEVYLPGAGWVGLDPTSGLFAGEGHIPLACSPEPSSAAPITGAVDEAEVEFEHQMSVTRIWEAPRVTKPYTERQWQAVLDLGHQVDQRLSELDVRLTQGGEPTFVAIDGRDEPEWNTEAMGPTKRRRALALYHKMKARYGAGGLAHFGQGKWYPGEPLPRWSLNLFWRRDGEPIWQDDRWIDDGAGTGAKADKGAGEGADDAARAERFLHHLAGRLGLDPAQLFPAYEDAFYYLWRERRLPVNVDPFDSRLDNPLERQQLQAIYSRGLDRPTGYVLPIAVAEDDDGWVTGPWFLRSERCYLVPGGSPMGYRLPLDSQPWVVETDYPWIHSPDPFAPREPLPPAGSEGRRAVPAMGPAQPPEPGESAPDIVRTALCVEPRDGVLNVFMPPMAELEPYLELVAQVEATAAALGQPVSLEGYEPPRDPRITNLRITPDPGVVEVNVQPVSSWEALVAQTEALYADAHECRLTPEKFMVDGRHVGTGGGNHMVLGAAHADDSPFLRRPDLLRSLVAFWHNHPSLSYLFSGLFIGPSSQAPRIDEARNDHVFEMELAFKELDRQCPPGGDCAPWLVDRLFRDLLTDMTGNTHRAEFCIDKLYSPDGPTGRLGLLELRAFEMPPHARMSLTQQLLLRALIARFWETPYTPDRLVRWGTELHDRFLLPHFVWQDFRDVLADLADHGLALDDAWFAPHFEFRFPRIGDYQVRGLQLELRNALEPWHVTGEHGAIGGTARYVDSSLERLQVRLRGAAPDRYQITCNQVPLPMQPTGMVGESVAGVRYRAWQPAQCLHPTLGVDGPLVFDVVDTWNERSLGGCEYHVSHPGGRSFETRPVNAFEAESRRMARFFRMGHHGGAQPRRPVPEQREFPFTLDLRFHH